MLVCNIYSETFRRALEQTEYFVNRVWELGYDLVQSFEEWLKNGGNLAWERKDFIEAKRGIFRP